ncbi:MAG TPA: M42 family metallopeptidase [Candidatus Omnitrophota bacterium]|jgi:endoglucanase|nr:M42 family metallopeptidase [Candidatus Omnitrophota bacterium]
MDASQALLKELCEGFGPPGHETEIAGMMKKHLRGLGEVTQDGLGSIICKKKGTSDQPRMLVAGHMDEVGFMVKGITPEGFIKFLPMGGWWGHVVLAQRVRIRTRKGDVIGVVGSKPPHELQEEERRKVLELKDMFIDVGATSSFDVRKKLGIRPGDPIVPESGFDVMANPRLYLAKALDNRVGCGLVVDMLRGLKEARHPNTVYGVATTMEEVGLRGAQTAVASVKPQVAIAVDVGIAHDTPGSMGDGDEKLGAGVGILVYDATLIPNVGLRDLAVEICEKQKIPFHLGTVERGGTDAGRFHVYDTGIPSLVIFIPTRYIHSHATIMDRKDYDAGVRLLVELAKRLDAKTVGGL